MLDPALITADAPKQRTEVKLTAYFLTDLFNEYAEVYFVSHDEIKCSQNQAEVNFKTSSLHYTLILL